MVKLVVLRPQFGSSHETRSNEVRLYEDRGETLRQVFAARPLPAPEGPPYAIKLVGIGRYDNTDREEAIFSLYAQYADSRYPRPIALLWDDAAQRYELRALLPHAASLIRPEGAWAVYAEKAYKPINIPLASGGQIANVGGVQGLMIRADRLAAGYEVKKTCNGCAGTWEFKTFCLNFRSPELSGSETDTPAYLTERRHHLAPIAQPGVGVGRYLDAALHRGFCEGSVP